MAIDISKLSGDVKAFAQAADVDQAGTQGYGKLNTKFEITVFSQLCKDAGLNMDEFDEQISLAQSADSVPTDKDQKKADEKQNKPDDNFKEAYKTFFGGQADAVRAEDNAANQRVAQAFRLMRGNVDPVAMQNIIKAKPNMEEYKDNPTGFAAALRSWADNAENAANNSVIGSVNAHTDETTEAIIENDNANADMIMDEIIYSTEQIIEQLETGKAEILEEIEVSKDEIQATIRTAEGKIIRAVKNAEGHIVSVVRQEGAATRQTVEKWGQINATTTRIEGRHTRQHVDAWGSINVTTTRQEGSHTREHVDVWGATNEQATREEGAHTRDHVTREADRTIDNLDPLGTKRATRMARDRALGRE